MNICDDCWSIIIEFIGPIDLYELSKASPIFDIMIFKDLGLRYVFGYQQMLPKSQRQMIAYKVGPQDMAIKTNMYVYIVSGRTIVNCAKGIRQNFKHATVEKYVPKVHGDFKKMYDSGVLYYNYGTFYVRSHTCGCNRIVVATMNDLDRYNSYNRLVNYGHYIDVTGHLDICNKYAIDFGSQKLVYGSKKTLNVVDYYILFQDYTTSSYTTSSV